MRDGGDLHLGSAVDGERILHSACVPLFFFISFSAGLDLCKFINFLPLLICFGSMDLLL
jgi:hypothetical protein